MIQKVALGFGEREVADACPAAFVDADAESSVVEVDPVLLAVFCKRYSCGQYSDEYDE